MKMVNYFPTSLPPMGWYFVDDISNTANVLSPEGRNCLFAYLDQVANSSILCFSADSAGCRGAACYLGFCKPHQSAGRFLASGEKFKSCEAYGEEFYRTIDARTAKRSYLMLSTLESMEDTAEVEVVNFWVKPLSLAGLLTLANFDSPKNDRVTIPFASGCQSMWTIPFREQLSDAPRATVGAMDPAMRKYVPADTLLFSLSTELLLAMVNNIEKSFATGSTWLAIGPSQG